MTPPLVIFDLDGTLAESKQPLTGEMATLLSKLIEKTRVAVISGGALSQFLRQVVEQLPERTKLEHLYLLPTSGAALYEFRNGKWKKLYEERISETEAHEIERAMRAGAEETEIIDFTKPAYGPRIEYRGGQVTLSALGQLAPIAEKRRWDPDHAKRRMLQAAVMRYLPAKFSAAMGGATTIDVTRKGIDKAYGIHQLSERLHIPEETMLYVGDELMPYGNDEAVFKTGSQTKGVKNPSETIHFIREILAPTR